ncbi:putative nucleotidyltransferase [compost metagenome]
MSKFRPVVLEMLSGSRNRNLNTVTSDVDIKQFLMPTFEDLYTGEVFKDFKPTPEKDVEIHDIRRLEQLLYKANMTYIELLFAVEINTYGHKAMQKLIDMREEIARMNLWKFYKSSMGMYNRQMKDMQNATSHTNKQMIQEYGYIPKKGMMALHFLRVVKKYHASGFTDFANSIWYTGAERDEMLDYKHGSLTYKEMTDLLHKEYAETILLEEDYQKQDFNEDTYIRLQELLRTFVFDNFVR